MSEAAAASPDVVYAIAHSRPLPHVDTAKTVKQVVLRGVRLRRFNRCVRLCRQWIIVSYSLGVLLAAATLFLPSSVGVWLAVASMPLQLLPSLVAVMNMRYELVLLVMQGYEFWYMTLSNLVVSALISFSFNDARFLILIGASVAFETALLLDANHRASRVLGVAAVGGACTNITYLACATFGIIEYGRDLELIRYKHRVLYADDMTANLIATLVVLLVRNGVRKFSHTETRRMAECITYRCRLALVSVDIVPHPILVSMERSIHSGGAKRQLVQLECIIDKQQFSSADVLFQWLNIGISLVPPWVLSRVLALASWQSLSSAMVALLSTNRELVEAASVASACGATLVFTINLLFLHKQLLYRLLTSFDFVFLSFQVTVSHICMADIVQWSEPRAFVVLASWLWVHWVLLLDAVPTVHKARWLGFRPHVASVALLLFMAEQVLVAVAIVFWDDPTDSRLELRDRVIVTLPLQARVKQLRVVPLLLGRMAATISWSLRLLWRLWDRADNELLLLQGRVQYENMNPFSSMESMQLRRNTRQVVPIAPS